MIGVFVVVSLVEMPILLYFDDAFAQLFNYLLKLPKSTRFFLWLISVTCAISIWARCSLIGVKMNFKGKILLITLLVTSTLILFTVSDLLLINMHHSSYKYRVLYGFIPLVLIISFLFTFFKSFLVGKVLKKYCKN